MFKRLRQPKFSSLDTIAHLAQVNVFLDELSELADRKKAERNRSSQAPLPRKYEIVQKQVKEETWQRLPNEAKCLISGSQSF